MFNHAQLIVLKIHTNGKAHFSAHSYAIKSPSLGSRQSGLYMHIY
jgi:hypothetical protein